MEEFKIIPEGEDSILGLNLGKLNGIIHNMKEIYRDSDHEFHEEYVSLLDIRTDLTVMYDQEQEQRKAGLKVHGFCADDVIHTALHEGITINKKEAEAILRVVDRKSDAENGVTWDTIRYYIDEFVKEDRRWK